MSLQQDIETKTFLCKYQVDNLVFMFGDENIQFDASNILTIEYINDYEFNIRSILRLALRMDTRRKLWILKNKRDITCKLELSKIGMDVEAESYTTNSEKLWNRNFKVYFNDADESIDVEDMEARLSKNEGQDFTSGDISGENYFESQNTMDVYLFNQELLTASTTMVNLVMTEDTLQQCVARILTASGHKDALMSNFENDEVYQELLVPANPAYKALIYLDQYYGFYEKGAMIYYDIDTAYILNTAGKVTAKRKGEWIETTFMISGVTSSTPGNGMMRRDGEKTFYISVADGNVNIEKKSDYSNAKVGSITKVVKTDDTEIDVNESDQTYIGTRNEYITYARKDDNKYTSSIIKARMEENDVIIYITGSNLDIGAFTPNKIFNVVFEDTTKHEKYGKFKYRLAYASHIINIESGNHMRSSHKITLKKCASND